MKKRILSFICSFALLASVMSFTVAQADDNATLKITTDAADVKNIKAGDTFNVSVELEGIENLSKWNSKKKNGTGLNSAQFVIFVPDNEYITSGSETAYSGAVINWIEVDGGYNLILSWNGPAANMISSVPVTMLTFDMTANTDLADYPQTFEVIATADTACKVVRQTFASGTLTEQTEFNSEPTGDMSPLTLTKLTVGGKEEATPTPTATPTVEPTPTATATPTPTPVVTPEPTPTVEPTPEVTPEPTEGKGTITTEDAADAAAWAWEEFTGVAGNAVKVSINANGSAYYKTFKLGALVENTGETRVGVIIQYNPQNFNDVSVTGVELVTAE